MFSSKPGGGEPMSQAEKKAAHKEAMVARKNINLSGVSNCIKSGNCNGANLNEEGSKKS